MGFITDKQTFDDLNIFGRHRGNNIYSLYNYTQTAGGSGYLEDMFLSPLTEREKIVDRSSIIQFMKENKMRFPFNRERIGKVEVYLKNAAKNSRLESDDVSLDEKLKRNMGFNLEYEMYKEGVKATVEMIKEVYKYFEKQKHFFDSVSFKNNVADILSVITTEQLSWTLKEKTVKSYSYEKVVGCDTIFRFDGKDLLERIMTHIYMFDAYISVGRVAESMGFVFPEVLPDGSNRISMVDFYHPHVSNPVANSIHVDQQSNVIFLTGANMAGKSTFMKAFGVVLFLAHMGFPVPAKRVEFSVCSGLYTTINLPDDIHKGYSHFYAEVLRVRKIVDNVSRRSNLVVIFDELFRGTNVKDAYDGTLVLTRAFARNTKNVFLISTHIIEAGEDLKKDCTNVNFVYFQTKWEGNKAVFPYKLAQGITGERHGMNIIRNEQIIDIITGKAEVKNTDSGKPGKFVADWQTLKDLELLGKFKSTSVFNLFNDTKTMGGEQLLEYMFENPITDEEELKRRYRVIDYFRHANIEFPLEPEVFDDLDAYLLATERRKKVLAFIDTWWLSMKHKSICDPEYDIIRGGIAATIQMFGVLEQFIQSFDSRETAYLEQRKTIHEIINSEELKWWRNETNVKKLSFMKVYRYDHILRTICKEQLKTLRNLLYELDVNTAVARVANKYDFTIPRILPKEEAVMQLEELFHPGIKNPVSNSFRIDKKQNMFFLTGANMAGKSTFMKAFGIAVYLAHVGLPVPAKGMTFSVRDGMYTSINVSDDLNLGYSHFYAEILRIKMIAEEVGRNKNLVLIFDELFKGVNVKDAYDATIAVTEAFTTRRNSQFLFSTHIIETGEVLQKKYDNLQCCYFPTNMEGEKIIYPYKLKEGITGDRHGMLIIRKHHIIEMTEKW